jgi:hypothetical protein
MKEADEAPDVGEELLQAQQRVQKLEQAAGVTNPRQLQEKLTMLTKRIEGYDAAIRKDPDWMKKSTGVDKGRGKGCCYPVQRTQHSTTSTTSRFCAS